MIDKKELRIGNWVSEGNGVQSQVETIAVMFVTLSGSNESTPYYQISAIPLTDDCLLRIGFENYQTYISN